MYELFRSILTKAFPMEPRNTSALSFEELEYLYAKVEVKFLKAYFAVGFATGVAWWFILSSLAEYYQSGLPSAEFTLVQSGLYWMLPAMLLGLATPSKPMEIILAKIMGKQRFQEFNDYCKIKHKVGERASNFVLYSGIVLCVIFVLLGINHYVLVHPNRLVLSGWLNPSTRSLSFDTLVSIRTAPITIAANGNEIERREYILDFRSGQRWTTNDAPMSLTVEQKPLMIQFISDSSGVPITELPVFSRDEL